MKRVVFYLLLLMFICCKDKDRARESDPFVIVGIEEESTRAPVRAFYVLDSAIIDQLVWYMKEMERIVDTTWNDRKCYTIDFYGKDSTRKCHPNDTILCFAYYNPAYRKNYEGYRGILRIANRKVAILDKDRIGERYYDTSKLERIPLENHEPSLLWDGKVINPYLCYLKDGWVVFSRTLVNFNYRKEWGIDTQE